MNLSNIYKVIILKTQEKAKLILKTISLIILFNFCLNAQPSPQSPDRGAKLGNSFAIGDFETINTTNGNLILNFPLGSLPSGRGSVGGGINLIYNSKLYNMRSERTPDERYFDSYFYKTIIEPDYKGGWKFAGTYSLEWEDRRSSYGPYPPQCGYPGNPVNDQLTYVNKLRVVFPDGSTHEMIPYGHYDKLGDRYFNVNFNGLIESCTSLPTYTNRPVYFSLDGSYIRLESTSAQDWILYFSDGTKVVNSAGNPQRIFDKNGNFVNVSSQVSDEFGRKVTLTYETNGDNLITSKGVNGEELVWRIKWKQIVVSKTYKSCENYVGCPQEHWISHLTPVFNVVDKIIQPQQLGGGEYKFNYNAPDYSLPISPSYGWGEISSIELPSGAIINYNYSMDGEDGPVIFENTKDILKNYPTLKTVTHSTQYDGVSEIVTDSWGYSITATGSSVSNPDGSGTMTDFGSTEPDSPGLPLPWNSGLALRVTESNGSKTENLWSRNLPVPCTHLAPPCQWGPPNFATYPDNPYIKATFQSIKNENGSFYLTAIKDFSYDKNGNVTQIKEYDFIPYSCVNRDIYQMPTGIPTSCQGQSVTPKRITKTNYYNDTPDATSTNYSDPDSYHLASSPRLLRLPQTTEIQNETGTPQSRTEITYDYTNYNSSNTKGGNPVLTKAWDNRKNGSLQAYSNPLTSTNSISTSVDYDQYGNPISMTDAKGNQTQITYGNITMPSGVVTGLYPTQVVSAYGSPIAQTVQTTYDFYTGLPKTVTTLGNTTAENVTSETEYDALGRPVKTKAAIGTPLEIWSTTEYDDVARRIITRADIEAKGDGKKIAIQHFDQLGRIRLARSIENVASENPYNESDGIKVQTRYQTGNPFSYQLTSNPYRAATSTAATNEPSMGWTRSKSANTGKHSEVETFTGSALPAPWGSNTTSTGVVTSDIDAERTLVTDQAGKRRISRTNALGQLVNVWEVKEADSDTESVSFGLSGGGTLSLNALKTSYSYDILNNLTTVNQGVQTRTFAYSSLSRLITANNPESGLISYAYDENGNLTKKTDARNVKTNYAYDALNRVTDRSYQDESPLQRATLPVKYIYDSNNIAYSKGKLTKVITGNVNSPFAVTEYQEFDLMGRVKKSQQTTDGTAYNQMEYIYNLSGALIEQKYPSGRIVKNTLDNDGDLAMVQSQRNQNAGLVAYAKHFTYTAAGAVSSMQLGNGAWESTVFNSRLQPTQIALGSVQNGTNKLKLDFTYNTMTNGTPNADNNGNVLTQTITTPSETRGTTTYSAFTAIQTYQYDALNRIKEAEEKIGTNQQWKQTFIYDRYGNRTFDEGSVSGQYKTTTLPRNCGTAPNLVCAKDNPQAIAASNKLQGIEYDSAGNTRTDLDNRRFTYDGENKQIKVETTDGFGNPISTLGEYFYDGDGKRVKKVSLENSQWITTIFVYDASGKMVAEYSTQTSTTPQVSYLTNDHLGSPRANTDAVGNVTARHDYQPFGEEVQRASHGTDQVRKKFTGYERDTETDLDFAQARMFGSGFGRFTSPDPILSSATLGEPQSWNRYSYVLNNPLVFTDPTGMFIWTKALGGDVEDDDLTQHFTDEANKITDEKKRNKALKKIDKKVKNIIKQRNQIRAGIEAAKGLLNSDKLSESQKSEISRSINIYGEEGDDNNVIVGQQANRNGGTMFGEDGRIIVTLGIGNNAQEIAIQFIHEGSHVADDVAFNNGVAGSDISLFATETRAWTVSAYAAQGFSLKSYPSSLPKNLRVWKEGWSEVDISTGVANRLAGKGYSLTPQKQGDNLSVIKARNIETVKARNSIWNWY